MPLLSRQDLLQDSTSISWVANLSVSLLLLITEKRLADHWGPVQAVLVQSQTFFAINLLHVTLQQFLIYCQNNSEKNMKIKRTHSVIFKTILYN